MLNRIILTLSTFFLLLSCLKEKAAPIDLECNTIDINYILDIKPLIKKSCATNQGPGTGCHDAWIFDYSNIVPKIEDGSWENRVLDMKNMPTPNNQFDILPLTEQELKTFKCWIKSGYPE